MAEKKSSNKKMSEEELRQWDALYSFVKYEVMGYDENMNLPQYLVLRLKGLTQGRHTPQTQDIAVQTYGYKVVLKTFEKQQGIIKWAIAHGKFNGENHKINWMMKLIENSINDVYLSMKDEENRLHTETTDLEKQKKSQTNKNNTSQTINDIVSNFENATKKTAVKTWSDDDETLW